MLAALALVVLSVVTTTTDGKALVEAVGGERVRVTSLAPPLHDPHAVDVRPGQLATLKRADLLVRIGLDHEPWLARVLGTVNDPRFVPGGARHLDLSKRVELLQTETPRIRSDRGSAHVHGFGNTHYTLDPENARPITAAILDALAALSPGDRGRFEANRAAFLERLDAGLARWSQAMARHRGARVVVMHDTWAYFARRFGLIVVAAVESTPGVPPSPAALQALIRDMRDRKVRLLISEPYANASLVRQIATKGGVPAVTLVPSVGGHPMARDYVALFDVDVGRLADALTSSP